MSPSPVNLVIIGAGVIGPRHAQAVLQEPSAHLLAFVDPSPNATAITAPFGVPLYASIDELLTTSPVKPDAAVVCTPNDTHVAISTALLDAGIHVLVEKPISVAPEDGLRLAQHARAKGLHLLVGHHRRFNPYVVATKAAIEASAIGAPIAVNGLWVAKKHDAYFTGPTAWRTSATSGGPVRINLIHDIDILQYLLGPIVRVFGERTPSRRGHEAEEGAAVVLRFASGVVGTFLLCDNAPSGHMFEGGTGENPMVPPSGRDFWRIFGTEGCLSVPDMTVSRTADWTAQLQQTTLVVSKHIVPFEAQMHHFTRVLRGEESPKCTGEEAVSAVLVCEAVLKTLEIALPVDIESPILP